MILESLKSEWRMNDRMIHSTIIQNHIPISQDSFNCILSFTHLIWSLLNTSFITLLVGETSMIRIDGMSCDLINISMINETRRSHIPDWRSDIHYRWINVMRQTIESSSCHNSITERMIDGDELMTQSSIESIMNDLKWVWIWNHLVNSITQNRIVYSSLHSSLHILIPSLQ